MSGNHLTAEAYLGLTLNLLKPVDVLSLSNTIKNQDGTHQAINLDTSTYTTTLSDGETFTVSTNVAVREIGSADGSLQIFNSGNDVKNAIQNDASFSASYLAVSTSGSVSQSSLSEYKIDEQYAFYSSTQTGYDVSLKSNEFLTKNLDPVLQANAIALPAWNALDDSCWTAFNTFFTNWGTHIITSAQAGSRYQLQIQMGQTSLDTSQSFKANVSADYNGIGSMKGDASVTSSTEYKEYTSASHATCHILGGALPQKSALDTAQKDPAAYQAWAMSSTLANCEVMSAQLTDLGTALGYSVDPAIKASGSRIASALDYLLNSQEYDIWVRLAGMVISPSFSVTCTLTNGTGTVDDIRVEQTVPFYDVSLTPISRNPLTFGFKTNTPPAPMKAGMRIRVRSRAKMHGTLQQTAGTGQTVVTFITFPGPDFWLYERLSTSSDNQVEWSSGNVAMDRPDGTLAYVDMREPPWNKDLDGNLMGHPSCVVPHKNASHHHRYHHHHHGQNRLPNHMDHDFKKGHCK